jgi:hypothetical protein
MEASIILVHLGPKPYPEYGYDCIEQARLFNSNERILLVVSDECEAIDIQRLEASRCTIVRAGALKRTEGHRFYAATNLLRRKGLGGFWLYATERFFLIEEAMRKLGIEDVVHLENDVLLYFSLAGKLSGLRSLYPGMAVARDHDGRCMASLLYIRNLRAISRLNDYIALNLLSRGKNDMQLLSDYSRRKPRTQLPLVSPSYVDSVGLANSKGERPLDPFAYSKGYDELGMVFDAACLGQFVGGIDKMHSTEDTRGFVNETSYLDPSKGSFAWEKDDSGRLRPFFCLGENKAAIANLHIHSKELVKYRSDRKQQWQDT